MVTTGAGETAFIDDMYVVFVPIILFLVPILNIVHVKISVYTWIAAGVSFIGLFLLSGCTFNECLARFQIGELYVFIGMSCWILEPRKLTF